MEISLFNPFLWAILVVLFIAIKAIVKRLIQLNEHEKLMERGSEFRRKRNEKFAKFIEDNTDLIPSEDIQKEILNCKSLRDLQDKLEAGAFTSVQLLMHYINRCQLYALKLNFIAQINFDSALKLAKECDVIRRDNAKMSEIRRSSTDNGLLFGIPICFKDHLFLKGTHSTQGCVNLLSYMHEETGILEQIVLNNGGIPFIKSNIPQLGLSFETNSNLYGKAWSPINHDRSPGGSSGGCAGLISTQTCPLSFGNDIGGSIRSPSSFWGIYGYKPTSRRVSCKSASTCGENFARGQEHIVPTIGPMGYSIDDIVFGMKLLFDNVEKSMDPYISPLKFDTEVYEEYRTKKRLRLGYYTYNQAIECTKPVKRAVMNVVNALKDDHDLIEIDTTFMQDVTKMYSKLLLSTEMNLKALGNEEFMPNYKGVRLGMSIPTILRPLVANILTMIGQERSALYARYMGVKDTGKFYWNFIQSQKYS